MKHDVKTLMAQALQAAGLQSAQYITRKFEYFDELTHAAAGVSVLDFFARSASQRSPDDCNFQGTGDIPSNSAFLVLGFGVEVESTAAAAADRLADKRKLLNSGRFNYGVGQSHEYYNNGPIGRLVSPYRLVERESADVQAEGEICWITPKLMLPKDSFTARMNWAKPVVLTADATIRLRMIGVLADR